MDLEELIRKRQDQIRGRPKYRREEFAEWLHDKWAAAPTLSEVLLLAGAVMLFISAALQIFVIMVREG